MPIINAFPEVGGGGDLTNAIPFQIISEAYQESSNYKTALVINKTSNGDYEIYIVSYGSSAPSTTTSRYPSLTIVPAVDLTWKSANTAGTRDGTFSAGETYTSTKGSYTSSSQGYMKYTFSNDQIAIASSSFSQTGVKMKLMTISVAS